MTQRPTRGGATHREQGGLFLARSIRNMFNALFNAMFNAMLNAMSNAMSNAISNAMSKHWPKIAFFVAAFAVYVNEGSLATRRYAWAAVEDSLLTLDAEASDEELQSAARLAPLVHVVGKAMFEHEDSAISAEVFSIRSTERRCQWHEQKWELVGGAAHDRRVRAMVPSDAMYREAEGDRPAAYVACRPNWGPAHVDSSSFLSGHVNAKWQPKVKETSPKSIRIGRFAVDQTLVRKLAAKEAHVRAHEYQPMQASDRPPPKDFKACDVGVYVKMAADCQCTTQSIGAKQHVFESLRIGMIFSMVGALELGRRSTAKIGPPAAGTLGAPLGAHVVSGSLSALYMYM
jgi:hypothetical protein